MSFPGSLPLDVLHMCCHTSLLGEVSVPHAAPLGDTWRLMPGFSCTLPHGSLSLTYFYLFPLLVINCNDNKTASGNSLSLRWWFREWTQPPNLSSLKLEKFFFFPHYMSFLGGFRGKALLCPPHSSNQTEGASSCFSSFWCRKTETWWIMPVFKTSC